MHNVSTSLNHKRLKTFYSIGKALCFLGLFFAVLFGVTFLLQAAGVMPEDRGFFSRPDTVFQESTAVIYGLFFLILGVILQQQAIYFDKKLGSTNS
jgi:hypothetical protein